MNWSDKSLKILSLDKSETAILKVLNTAKSVQDIARDSQVSRTGIVYCLKKLFSKGLISTVRFGKRKLYVTITDSQLANNLQRVVDEIKLGEKDKKGVRIKTAKENEFIIHVGVKEIIPAYERIASSCKNERIKAIQHHDSWNELLKKLPPKQLIKFNQTLVDNHIILDGILNDGAYDSYVRELQNNKTEDFKESIESLTGRMADYSYFADNFFKYNAEIWFFKTTTLIINWHEEVAIEITNSSMTNFLKDMFEFVKSGCRKINHNETMNKVLETYNKQNKQ
jgi:DNA-binding MarR family transcriptional regulator